MKHNEIEDLIYNIETSMRNLRQACVDRGITPSLSITWYGDSMDLKEGIYPIGEEGPLKGILQKSQSDYLQYHNFRSFIEELFLIPSKQKQLEFSRSLNKRNQEEIERLMREEE